MSYAILRSSLAGVLATAYNVQEDELQTILPTDETVFDAEAFRTAVLEKDTAKVARGKEKFEQGYSKAKAEVLAGFEAELRSKFEIAEDLRGVDLVAKIAEEQAKSNPSYENVTTHPDVIKLLNDKESAFKKSLDDLKGEYEEKEKTFQKERVFEKVSTNAFTILDSLKPILSNDAQRANNQKRILLQELKGYDFQENQGVITVLKDGKRLENEHGHGVTFEQLVKEKAEAYFDFQASDKRETPAGGGSGQEHISIPKNEVEYAKVMSDRSIPIEDRRKIQNEYEASQKSNS